MDYLTWTIEWFQKNGSGAVSEAADHIDENFFALGYIDSFGFISLIAAVDETFHISFANDRFQDRSFSTIRGFSESIAKEVNCESGL